MKNFLKYILLFGAMIATIITGCNEETQPDNPSGESSVEVTSVKASAASAEVVLNTSGIISYAYVCLPEGEDAPANEAIVFASGVEHALLDGTNTITVYAGEPLTSYVAYMAFKKSDGMFYGKIVDVPFTTTDYQDIITQTGATVDGYSVHIEMPQEVLDRGNRLRYSFCDIATYNMIKYYGNFPQPDGSTLVYDPDMDKPVDITYNNDNIYLKDENGTEILDENGDYIMNHNPIAPGEPTYVTIGEFSWADDLFGWGGGYWNALFDAESYNDRADRGEKVDESDYWSGVYKNVLISSAQPSPFDGDLKIEVIPAATRAHMKFTPSEDVYQYCFMVMPHGEYVQVVENFLEGREEYLQWFTTSFMANYYFIAPAYKEAVEVDAVNFIYMTAETDYHILAVAMGDEYASTQRFFHETFTTTEKTMQPPVIKVTDIPTGDPYQIAFNIKAPNADLVAASYMAHYESEVVALINNGYTFDDIISQNGNALQDIEVAAINSPDGYTVTFSTREDATTILAIRGMNSEDTYNTIGKDLNNDAVGVATSIAVPKKDYVDSDLYEALKGEWIATFDVYTPGSTSKPSKTQRTVEIFRQVEYPATLPEDVYATFEEWGITREKTTEYYNDFKAEADYYNQKLIDQNRMVGVGVGVPDIPAATPYELFTSNEANFSTVESIFFEYGPKWFLDIDEKGSVSIPMNYSKLPSSSYWCLAAEFYLIGVNADKGVIDEDRNKQYSEDGFFHFPVEVSEDRDTITIKPIVLDGVPYYMNIGYQQSYSNYWYFYLSKAICSEIVLTREVEEVAPAINASGVATIPASSMVGNVSAEKAVRLDRTSVDEPTKYRQAEYTIPTLKEIEAAMLDRYINKR